MRVLIRGQAGLKVAGRRIKFSPYKLRDPALRISLLAIRPVAE
jgi:hypothetical protein